MTTIQSSLVSSIGNLKSIVDCVSVSRTSTTRASDSSNLGRCGVAMIAAQQSAAAAKIPPRASLCGADAIILRSNTEWHGRLRHNSVFGLLTSRQVGFSRTGFGAPRGHMNQAIVPPPTIITRSIVARIGSARIGTVKDFFPRCMTVLRLP